MASFQKTVLTIAVVVLIIALILFAILMVQSSKKYPPIVANCPDYWVDLSGGIGGDGSSCYNVKNLGKDKCKKEMDFSADFWTGDSGTCNKQNWAKGCDLTWDGVSNNTNACSESTGDGDSTKNDGGLFGSASSSLQGMFNSL